jgi:hypothetical protein
MTYKDRLMPTMSLPDLLLDARRPRLGIAWWEAATAQTLSLTWATIRLWTIPTCPGSNNQARATRGPDRADCPATPAARQPAAASSPSRGRRALPHALGEQVALLEFRLQLGHDFGRYVT